jgi:hypothetical protein
LNDSRLLKRTKNNGSVLGRSLPRAVKLSQPLYWSLARIAEPGSMGLKKSPATENQSGRTKKSRAQEKIDE